jgi:hypothetical protein
MGNDGGSIPKRSELVKEKKKDPVADARIQTIARWFYCALSKVGALIRTAFEEGEKTRLTIA